MKYQDVILIMYYVNNLDTCLAIDVSMTPESSGDR
jgi:hypothetical protein